MKNNIFAIVLTVVIAFALTTMMTQTIHHVENSILEERWAQLVHEIDTRCNETDYFALERDHDWQDEYIWYRDSMAYFIADIDARYNIFAAVYGYNEGNVETMSDRNPTFVASPFDPWSYEAIIKSVIANNSDTLNVSFKYSATQTRNMRVYFRKVPLEVEDCLIVFVGMPFAKGLITIPPAFLHMIYAIYAIACISFGVAIFLFTRYVERYKELIAHLRHIGVKTGGKQ